LIYCLNGLNLGGAIVSGIPLGVAINNFSQGEYVSGLTWAGLSVVGGIKIYERIKKKYNYDQLMELSGEVSDVISKSNEAIGLYL